MRRTEERLSSSSPGSGPGECDVRRAAASSRRASATVWYRLAKPLVRWGIARIVQSRFEGLDRLPTQGPCILVPNHQSVLDPLLLQGNLPRAVDSMTKSTQFAPGLFRWILPRLHAFPVRRYRVDPQSVRVLLRRLEEGRVICVYPEGERSWDGYLQPFRRGTLRVILRAGVPVVPVGIDGTYDAWPRWASRPRRGGLAHVRLGEPMYFGAYRDRQEREAAVPHLEKSLRAMLLELSGESRRTESGAAAPSRGDSGQGSAAGAQ